MSRAATQQDTTDDFLPRLAVIAVMRAADRSRRAMVRTLQDFNLTLPQFNVLTILRHHPELPTLDVAARLVEETPGITRLMNTLVAKKYIRRRPAKHDRRQQLCSLTAAGRRAVDAALQPFDDTQVGIISGLSETEARELVSVLRRVAPATTRVPRPSLRDD